MIATFLVSLVLLGVSGVLLDLHRRSWRNAEQNERLAQHERRFALAQYRRRMQASGLIGLLGAAIACESLVPREPLSIVLYVASLTGACLAIMLLAMIDAWASRRHFARLHSDQSAARFKLVRELRTDGSAAEEYAEQLKK